MQITFHFLALLVGVFTLAASAAEPTSPYRLRAWRYYRSLTWPLDLFVEVDYSSGNVVVNKTLDYPGFDSYIQPSSATPSSTPIGKLFSKNLQGDKTYKGYLVPLGPLSTPNTTAMHYQLQFSKTIPNKKGVLSAKFTYFESSCGLNCRGSILDYDTDDSAETNGQWYIIREKKKKNSPRESYVWDVRWIAPINSTAGEFFSFPEGALGISLWV